MNFSEKLKMLRKSNNLTQEELSEKLNVSRQAITKWESGEGIPDIDNLKQISILFNTTIDELVKEEKEVIIKKEFSCVKELEIDHTKHFDINISKASELNILPSEEEKVKVEVLSSIEFDKSLKVIFDDLYNRLDIDIKNKMDDITINMYIPEKYIDEIELNSKTKTLNISNLDLKEFEYDGTLKYLNVSKSSGKMVLNTTKCDVEATYDKFDGELEVNIINSVARLTIPKGTIYKTIAKGIKNEFVNANSVDESNNIIELNGANSKLIITEV